MPIEDKIYPRESIIDELKYLREFYKLIKDFRGNTYDSDDFGDATDQLAHELTIIPKKYWRTEDKP